MNGLLKRADIQGINHNNVDAVVPAVVVVMAVGEAMVEVEGVEDTEVEVVERGEIGERPTAKGEVHGAEGREDEAGEGIVFL
jgi:hypothetical protein